MTQQAPVAVVVPAYNEARLIGRTIKSMPAWVDQIIVVDDASPDHTVEAAECVGDPRVYCVRHRVNRGVGAAIVSGYHCAFLRGAAVAAVMAGDAQMDPNDLQAVIGPILCGQADYVKGNRLVHPDARQMPLPRRIAGRGLAHLTNWATGLSIGDSQCGYTALSPRAYAALDWSDLWPRYGYPNDLLALLAAQKLRIAEVPVRPIYADERSGVRPWHALRIAALLARRYAR